MSKVILGIDVSKKELSLCLLKNEWSYCKTVCNSENGFEEIVNFISKKTSEKPEIYLEATGSYSEPVSDFLFDHGFDVKVVNPMKIYSFSKTKLSRNKTDQSDAKLIAEYGSKFEEVSYRKLPENIKELRALYRCSLALKKQNADWKNHLEQRDTLPESVVNTWINLLENIKIQIKNVNKSIMNIINSSTDLKDKFENLCSIPAIGETTAIAILAEIQDVSNFDSARQLASFVGLTPRHKNSGTSVNCKNWKRNIKKSFIFTSTNCYEM